MLSFVFLGIYWNNHHHMFHVTKQVTGGILWANLHLLFWLSLVPFTTAWMGDTPRGAVPDRGLRRGPADGGYRVHDPRPRDHGVPGRALAAEGGLRRRPQGLGIGRAYALAIPIAFVLPRLSAAIYAGVAMMWLIPDRRIEKHMRELT